MPTESTGSGPDDHPAPGDGAIGFGEVPGPTEKRWEAAGAELTPEMSVSRISANARATVAAVAIVGTLLTGLGLLSTQALPSNGLVRPIAVAAAAAAAAAVLLGLLYLALRLERVNVQDLGEVEAWYTRQFRRAYLAVGASWLLVLAVLLAAVTAALSLGHVGRLEPSLSLRVAGTGDKRSVEAEVSAFGLDAGAVVVVRVVGMPGACPEVILLESKSRADQTGKLVTKSTIGAVPCNEAFRLDVSGDGIVPSSLTLP